MRCVRGGGHRHLDERLVDLGITGATTDLKAFEAAIDGGTTYRRRERIRSQVLARARSLIISIIQAICTCR